MITPIRTQYLGLALALCWAAPTASAQTTRDSAGIRLIDNAKPVWRPGHEWRLSERPILVIGGRTGADDQLGRIVGATRLSDGRVVVGDQSTLQLKFYDASGRHLKSVGGKAQGPGESSDFRSIARLAGIPSPLRRMTGRRSSRQVGRSFEPRGSDRSNRASSRFRSSQRLGASPTAPQ
jgi:hypothetical protein